MSAELIEFFAPLRADPDIPAGYMRHYLALPAAIADRLGETRRVVGHIDGHPFRRALHRRPDGTPCVKFGRTWLRDAGLSAGDDVVVGIGADPDPDGVDVPPALAAALDAHPAVARAWTSLTAGKRRTLVYPITRARRPETQRKRAEATIDAVCRLTGARRSEPDDVG